MANTVTQDALKSLDSIIGIVSSLLGPETSKVLMVKETGEVAITNDGCTLMYALSLSHPVARRLTKSCKSYQRIHGDGTKSYLLMVCAALSYICDRGAFSIRCICYQKQPSPKQFLIKSLQWISKCILQDDKFLQHVVDKFCFVSSLGGDGSDFVHVAKLIVMSYFSGKFSKVAVEKLSALTMEMLTGVTGKTMTNFLNAIDHSRKHFDSLCMEVCGPLFNSSKVVDGAMIPRSNSSKGLLDTNIKQNVVFVKFDSNFCRPPGMSVEYSSSDAVQFLEFPTKLMNEWLDEIMKLNITVIFFQGRSLESFRFLCQKRLLVLIDCITVDEMQFLLDSLKFQPILDIAEDLNQKMVLCINISEILIGNEYYLKLKNTCKSETQDHSMLLCSPSPGLCSQYKLSVYNSLCVLQNWLNFSAVGFEKVTGFAVKGGGKFPLQLLDLLQNPSDVMKVLGNKWSSSEMNLYSNALPVVSELLLAIPRTLHNNSTDPKDKCNRFILTSHLIQSTANQNLKQPAMEKSPMQENITHYPLHPTSSQLMLVTGAIESTCQLLKIDAVISANSTFPHDAGDSSDS